MLRSWCHTGLKEVLMLGTSGVAIVAAVIAGIWAITGYYLGRRYDQAANQDPVNAATEAATQES